VQRGDPAPLGELRLLVVETKHDLPGAGVSAGPAGARRGRRTRLRALGRTALRALHDGLRRPDEDEELAALRQRAALLPDRERLVGLLDAGVEELLVLVDLRAGIRIAPRPEERDELVRVLVG